MGWKVSSREMEKALPTVERVISQEQVSRYARVSGDHNPIHLDPEFAGKSQFGGVVAHGMLTLAYISEMLAAAFGQTWLESGKLKVRFKAPAYIGDTLRTWGEITREESGPHRTSVECSVGVYNHRGEELVSGTASISLPRDKKGEVR
jgi:3-hydroxybutyryl-CoA dehydratase